MATVLDRAQMVSGSDEHKVSCKCTVTRLLSPQRTPLQLNLIYRRNYIAQLTTVMLYCEEKYSTDSSENV